MAESRDHFFSDYEKYHPYFQFDIVKTDKMPQAADEAKSKGADKTEGKSGSGEEFTFTLGEANFNNLESITVTREAIIQDGTSTDTSTKLPKADITFQYSASRQDKIPLLPFLNPGQAFDKRILISNGYTNLSWKKRFLLVYRINVNAKKKIKVPDKSSKTGDKEVEIVTSYKVTQVDGTDGPTVGGNKKEYLFPFEAGKRIAFAGVIGPPSVSGSKNGMITASYQMTSAMAVGFSYKTGNFFQEQTLNTIKGKPTATGASTSTTTVSQQGPKPDSKKDATAKAALDLIAAEELTEEEKKALTFSVLPRLYFRLTGKKISDDVPDKEISSVPLDGLNVGADFTALKGYKIRTDTNTADENNDDPNRGLLFKNNIFVESVFESKQDYLERICSHLKVNYISIPVEKGYILKFYPSRSTDYNKAIIKEMEKGGSQTSSSLHPYSPTPKFFEGDGFVPAIVMRYGEAVTSFSWSQTPISGGNGSRSVSIERAPGDFVTFELNKDNLAAAAKQLGLDTGNPAKVGEAIEFLTKWATSNVDGFLLFFYNVAGKLSPKIPPENSGGGLNGIKMKLELKWGIPGLMPGEYIFFDGLNEDNNLPDFLKGVYIIEKVTDKFDGKTNIFTQTLDCIK